MTTDNTFRYPCDRLTVIQLQNIKAELIIPLITQRHNELTAYYMREQPAQLNEIYYCLLGISDLLLLLTEFDTHESTFYFKTDFHIVEVVCESISIIFLDLFTYHDFKDLNWMTVNRYQEWVAEESLPCDRQVEQKDIERMKIEFLKNFLALHNDYQAKISLILPFIKKLSEFSYNPFIIEFLAYTQKSKEAIAEVEARIKEVEDSLIFASRFSRK